MPTQSKIVSDYATFATALTPIVGYKDSKEAPWWLYKEYAPSLGWATYWDHGTRASEGKYFVPLKTT